jgi:hypothetical protein
MTCISLSWITPLLVQCLTLAKRHDWMFCGVRDDRENKQAEN